MSQPNGQKENATSSTQNSVEEIHKPSYLTEQEPIPKTPLMLTRIDELWFITIANTKLTAGTKTKQEQLKKLQTEMWFIMLNLMIHVNTRLIQHDKLTQNKPIETDKNTL